MKKFKSIFLILLLTIFVSAQNVDNYMDQGGDHWHIKGTLTVESAGIFNVASGGIFQLAGVNMATQLGYLSGVTAGTAAASKCLVLGASGEIATITTATFTTATATNVNVGASGTKGVFTLYPTTASKGSFILDLTDQTGDTAVTFTIGAMGQATAVNLTDMAVAATYLVQSTAALTLAEADVLDGASTTQTANKAVIADTNVNIGVSKVTELHIGATGSEAQVTATPAEINVLASGIARSELTEDALAVYGIPTYEIRAADRVFADMGISETAGDHYLVLAANVITLVSEIANNETETAISYFMFVLPPEYVAAGDVKIRLKHTVAGAGTSASSTVDFEVYEQDGNGAVGADICATGAVTQTEDAWVTSDFVVTATTLVAGDILIVKFTSVTIENATANIQASFDGFAVLLDIKG